MNARSGLSECPASPTPRHKVKSWMGSSGTAVDLRELWLSGHSLGRRRDHSSGSVPNRQKGVGGFRLINILSLNMIGHDTCLSTSNFAVGVQSVDDH